MKKNMYTEIGASVLFYMIIIIVAFSTPVPAQDLDGDNDVDGLDLALFADGFYGGDPSLESLADFSTAYGGTNWGPAGVVYYVDFENGNDSADGLTPESAWQHAPGDPLAVLSPSEVLLQPGDRVLLKGGVVYRGQIRIPADGADQAPITYRGDGWPELEGVRAIIDGSEALAGWLPCPSAQACGDIANYNQIYYTDISGVDSPFTLNLHESDPATGEDKFLWLAQYPNPTDPYVSDDSADFIPISQEHLTRTSIADPGTFGQADPAYWQGSYLMIWINPNMVVIREILDFDPDLSTVYFEDLGENAIYPDGRDQAYAVYNSPHALDAAGQYYVGPEAGGTRRVMLWPRSEVQPDTRLTRSVRTYGIDLGSRNHIVIQGFEIRKHSGENTRQGVALGTLTAAQEQNQDIVIQDNWITHNAYSGTGNSRVGYGGIYLSNVRDAVIRDNEVASNPRHRGIFLANAESSWIDKNLITRPGGTALSLYTGSDVRLTGNTIRESNGSHANGITLYMGCRNILVAGNTVLDSGSPLTFQDSGNLYFINNIIDGHNAESNVNEWGDTSHGPWERGVIAFFHNVMVRNSRNAALNIGQIPENTYIVKHNIFDGGAAAEGIDRSHNIYTGLCWNQAERYGWYLGEGEWIEEDLSLIFADPENLDFHLIPGSPAIAAGTDITDLFPLDLFPEFDFTLDKEGSVRTDWDLGVYGY